MLAASQRGGRARAFAPSGRISGPSAGPGAPADGPADRQRTEAGAALPGRTSRHPQAVQVCDMRLIAGLVQCNNFSTALCAPSVAAARAGSLRRPYLRPVCFEQKPAPRFQEEFQRRPRAPRSLRRQQSGERRRAGPAPPTQISAGRPASTGGPEMPPPLHTRPGVKLFPRELSAAKRCN